MVGDPRGIIQRVASDPRWAAAGYAGSRIDRAAAPEEGGGGRGLSLPNRTPLRSHPAYLDASPSFPAVYESSLASDQA